MLIDHIILMREGTVALFAGSSVPVHRRKRIHFPKHLVILGAVAIYAMEVSAIGRKVNVDVTRCFQKGRFQIAMLDVVASSAIEMAHTAILTDWPADALCHKSKIDGGIRIPGISHRLDIGACVIVAAEAIDVQRITEIERPVSPSIPNMARITGCFVS
jgi:hypothetical protein